MVDRKENYKFDRGAKGLRVFTVKKISPTSHHFLGEDLSMIKWMIEIKYQMQNNDELFN